MISRSTALACSCAALLLAACATASAPAPRVVALANGDFEADFPRNYNCPVEWGCTMHADPHSFRYYLDEATPKNGKRSLCIEPLKKEPWARASQFLLDKSWQGAIIRFSVDIRVENMGKADGMGGGAFITVQGGSGQVLATKSNLVKGPTGWQRVEVELPAPAGGFVLEFGVGLVGPGRVCADDARLEIQQVSKSPV
jgi:hypothetical protein